MNKLLLTLHPGSAMQMIRVLPSEAPVSAFPALFAHFMAGHITDNSWDQFMHIFDDAGTTPEERAALAEFFHDALQDLGAEELTVPKVEEVQDLLLEIRPLRAA